MPKPRKSISVRIPAYAPSRLEWRRKIQACRGLLNPTKKTATRHPKNRK